MAVENRNRRRSEADIPELREKALVAAVAMLKEVDDFGLGKHRVKDPSEPDGPLVEDEDEVKKPVNPKAVEDVVPRLYRRMAELAAAVRDGDAGGIQAAHRNITESVKFLGQRLSARTWFSGYEEVVKDLFSFARYYEEHLGPVKDYGVAISPRMYDWKDLPPMDLKDVFYARAKVEAFAAIRSAKEELGEFDSVVPKSKMVEILDRISAGISKSGLNTKEIQNMIDELEVECGEVISFLNNDCRHRGTLSDEEIEQSVTQVQFFVTNFAERYGILIMFCGKVVDRYREMEVEKGGALSR